MILQFVQNKLAPKSKSHIIRNLHQIIVDGSTDELRKFHHEHSDVLMTEDALGGPDGRSGGTCALKWRCRLEMVKTLYEIGMINRDNELQIYAEIAHVYTYANWPGNIYMLSRILERPDALDIRIIYDKSEPLSLADVFNGTHTHYYGKPIPMVLRMVSKMHDLGFPYDVHGLSTPFTYPGDDVTKSPSYNAWMKLGTPDEDPDFLP
jgi:hypothetical protein